MNNSFCSDFCANVFADFLAGLIVAVMAALWLNLWLGKRLSELARSEERKAEKRARLEKAMCYLKLLKVEIDRLSKTLSPAFEDFENSEWGKEIWISTARWDVLQPSGELPWLLDAELVDSLALFYDALLWAKQGRHWVVTSWLVPTNCTVPELPQKKKAFKEMASLGHEEALKLGRDLPDKLDSEIRRLNTELKTP